MRQRKQRAQPRGTDAPRGVSLARTIYLDPLLRKIEAQVDQQAGGRYLRRDMRAKE